MQKLNIFKNGFDDNDLSSSIDFGKMLAHMDAIVNGNLPYNERDALLHFCTQIGLSIESPVVMLYRAFLVGYFAGLDKSEEAADNKILNCMEQGRD